MPAGNPTPGALWHAGRGSPRLDAGFSNNRRLSLIERLEAKVVSTREAAEQAERDLAAFNEAHPLPATQEQ